MCQRRVLEAIFYVMRNGILWKALPKEFGSSSSVHRYFRYWCEKVFFQNLWVAGLGRYDEAQGIDWGWLSADGCMTKTPWPPSRLETIPPTGGEKGASGIFLLTAAAARSR